MIELRNLNYNMKYTIGIHTVVLLKNDISMMHWLALIVMNGLKKHVMIQSVHFVMDAQKLHMRFIGIQILKQGVLNLEKCGDGIIISIR